MSETMHVARPSYAQLKALGIMSQTRAWRLANDRNARPSGELAAKIERATGYPARAWFDA